MSETPPNNSQFSESGSSLQPFEVDRASVFRDQTVPGAPLQTHKEIEKYLKKEKRHYDQYLAEPKLLILGSSDSGKSTLLKQMKILYGGILAALRSIVMFVASEGKIIDKKYYEILEVNEGDPAEFVGELGCEMWRDRIIQKGYLDLPSNLLPETTIYFLDSIDRIQGRNYRPTDEGIHCLNLFTLLGIIETNNLVDMLKLRFVTQNISETIFQIEETKFHFFDVSGLKHHRKYWVPFFSHVLVEDETTNRCVDSLILFEEIANNPLLDGPNIILFLNKKDIFAEKARRVSIKDFFPDFDGKITSY